MSARHARWATAFVCSQVHFVGFLVLSNIGAPTHAQVIVGILCALFLALTFAEGRP